MTDQIADINVNASGRTAAFQISLKEAACMALLGQIRSAI